MTYKMGLSDGDGVRDGKLTPDVQAEIDGMSHFRLAWIVRCAPVGSPYLTGAVGAYLMKRFESLGGMTPEIAERVDRLREKKGKP